MSKFNITVASWPSTGSTTLGLILSYIYNLKYFSSGTVFRYFADKLGYGFEGKDFNRNEDKYADFLDTFIDEYNKSLLEEGGYLIVTKPLGFLVDRPDTFSVFLVASIESRADRAVKEGREARETIAEGLTIRQKDAGERYKSQYGFDWEDQTEILRTHELVIDVSSTSLEDETQMVIEKIRERNNIEPFHHFPFEDISPAATKMKATYLVKENGLELPTVDAIKGIYKKYKDRIGEKPEKIQEIFRSA